MKLIRGRYNLPHFKTGCALTIGNFDGCHLGHQHILTQLKHYAQQHHLPTVAMLFEPQPSEYFLGNSAPARLMTLRDKINTLSDIGIDYLFCLRFNRTLATYPPEQFIQDILVQQLNFRYLSVGDDFHFGFQRQGNFEMLLQASHQFNFQIEKHHSYLYHQQRISSTAIRQALAQDNLTLAEQMLGRPYTITGRVRHGNKLGRTIGFPTANIALKRQVIPIQGVYVIRVKIINRHNKYDHYYQGIANIGNRPTIDGTLSPLLEVHLFEFSQQLYGDYLHIEFLQKIRNEQKFNSLEQLKKQIELDEQYAQNFFTKKRKNPVLNLHN